MGKAFSVLSGPFRNFNLESRVFKIISKSKPVPAPKHKSNQLEYGRLLKEHPETAPELHQKDAKLYENLKDIYVTSKDPLLRPPPSSSSADRPLPLNRKSTPDYEFGFPEPEKVPLGKVTLRNALKFISEHQTKPAEYTVSDVAEEYKLPVQTVENIMKYFRVYEVYIPQKKAQTTFAGPLVPRRTIVAHKHKELPGGDEKG